MLSSPEVWKEFFEVYYRNEINRLAENIVYGRKSTLYVDVKKDLLFFREMRLMEELFSHPDKVIKDAQDGLALVHTIHDVDLTGCRVRFKNIPSYRRLLVKNIDCNVINRFVAVEGIVRRVTEVRPYVIKAVYECQNCGSRVEISTGNGRLSRSIKCQCKGRMELQINECELTNIQRVEIQDLPENLDSGEPPRLLRVVLMDELAGKILPGDKVIINGIARATIDKNSSAILDVYLEANSLEYIQQDVRSLQITESDKRKIIELARRSDIYDLLVKSIAPSIRGYEIVKLAIVLQLFGGVSRINPDGTRVRGDIHVLLVGDPSVAKSQILRAVKQVAPRAVLTTGYSSSGAGLTVTAVKGEDGKWTIEAGALVLADRGIALIDELEKMNKNDRRYILEALEQQSFHKDFELILADGRKVKIGKLVDELIESNRDKVIMGKDTEILPVDGLYLLAYDPERKDIFKVKANRVSRHKAPDRFVRIRFSNGREILVTPEHPIMVWDEGIKEKPAETVKVGDLAIGVRSLPLESVSIDPRIAKLLGYLLSKEHRRAVRGCMSTLGDYRVKTGTRRPYTIRTNSKRFYKMLEREFPEIFLKCPYKRIPWRIMASNEEAKRAFLNGFFKGSGFIDCDVGFLTSSKDMAEDLQDLLLSLGIRSYIYERDDGKQYKVIVSGVDSLKFLEIVSDDLRGKEMIDERFTESEYYCDIVPDDLIAKLKDVLNALGMDDDGLTNNVRREQNAHRKKFLKYLNLAEKTLKEIKEKVELGDLESAKRIVSLKDIPSKFGVSYKMKEQIFEGAKRKLIDLERKIKDIRKIIDGNVMFLRVIKVEIVPNEDSKWVYDVTVEPTHLFVSHGLVLHNTISISKAGINATLNSRCSVLAAANPKRGRFNRFEPLVEQIDIEPPLLSRFDLVFVIMDEPDERKDEELAEFILSDSVEEKQPAIPVDLLRKYILYVRREIKDVKIDEKAKRKLKEFYKMLRGMSKEDNAIAITARQLEALRRLTEASAKARLSRVATVEDAERAISIFRKCLEQIAIDPETGKIDIDYAFTGTSATQRDRIAIIKRIIEELEMENERGAPEEEIFRLAEQRGISRQKAEEILVKLRQNGEIFSPRNGLYKVVKYD